MVHYAYITEHSPLNAHHILHNKSLKQGSQDVPNAGIPYHYKT